MSEHTPTPWDCRQNLIIENGTLGNLPRHRLGATFNYRGNANANAAFIVKAVNAHDDLVEALKTARQHAVTLGGDVVEIDGKIVSDAIHAAVLHVIDEALAKATSHV